MTVKEDLEKSFNRYSMRLKYCITSQEHDLDILNHSEREPEQIEKMLGIHWCLVTDTITAVPKYN